jgi:hypothetical protein
MGTAERQMPQSPVSSGNISTPPRTPTDTTREILPTPPTTPIVRRKEGGADGELTLQEGTEGTPTALGKWLKIQKIRVDSEPTIFLADLVSLEAVRSALKEYVTEWTEDGVKKDVTDYAKRIINVCRLIPASPPSNPTLYAKKKQEMLRLIFSWNAKYSPCLSYLPYRDIERVSADTTANIKAYCIAFSQTTRNAISMNIGGRFLALELFGEDIAAPKNLCWTFLVLSQLIWEKLARRHGDVLALNDIKEQNLQVMVNGDIRKLCSLAKKNASRDAVKGVKVRSFCSFLLLISEVNDVLHRLDVRDCSRNRRTRGGSQGFAFRRYFIDKHVL